MSDLISRQDAMKKLQNFCDWCKDGRLQGAEFVLDCFLPNLPSARPKGEWIVTGRTNIYGGTEIQCPFCGDKVMVQHIEDELFCRNCGADMRGKNNE